MKVHVVDIDNGEDWEDYSHWVDSVHQTYRGATEYLISKGFSVCARNNIFEPSGINLMFSKLESDNYYTKTIHASIYEFELSKG